MLDWTKFNKETEDERLKRERKMMDEFHQKLMNGPEDVLMKFLVSTGIYDENGQLTEPYR